MNSPEITSVREEGIDPIDFTVGCFVVTLVVYLMVLTFKFLSMH
jgi:hypothetical protein